MSDFVDAFKFIGDNSSLVLHDTGVHVFLSAVSVAIALVIAVPLGIWLGHIHRGSFLAINVSNLGRALPSLAILSILLPFIGIGRLDVIIALIILAVPPILTNTYVAIDQVESEVVESAQGMGMRPLEVLFRIELPLAVPLIFAGVRTAAVFVVATATLAGFFGGGGLGDIIANQASFRLAGVLGASFVAIGLAFAADGLFAGVQWLLTPRGLHRARKAAEAHEGMPVELSEQLA